MHLDGGTVGGGGEIHLDRITKIEGHGSIDVVVKDGRVSDVKLKITESKRFYTQAIRGKNALALPVMTSRICGTCSIAHLTCCTAAVESALGCEPSEQTLLLRKLSMYGMMIRDHALHLFIFCLPDLFGKDSVLDFDKSQDEMIRRAFAIKSAGNNLSKAIAGRAVHATFAEVGRFSHVPTREDIKRVAGELRSVRDYVTDFLGLFYNCAFKHEHETDFVSLVTGDYSFLGGNIEDSMGFCVLGKRYPDYLERIVIPYSTASAYTFAGREYMVGALARMNLNRENLHKDTKKGAARFLGAFPSNNIYHNNLAQAIEILHCIDHSLELLDSMEPKEEGRTPIVVRAGTGIGMLEAPRGTLYYMLNIGADGKVRDGAIITPTQQNQIGMEKSIGSLVERNMDMRRESIEFEMEKLVRAYDPCMSCASHFLKVNWRGLPR